MTVRLPSVEIAFAILCEGVRREDNGKLFAYGMFGNNVLLPSFPALLELCLLLRIMPVAPGEHDLHFKVMVSDQEVVKFGGKVKSIDGSPETTATPIFPVQIESPGTLSFAASDDGENWATVLSMPVMQNPNVTA